ncbi:hypothetical protein [Gemmatimonas sp.]|jgi:hypothetical protein|uniref:hypothetical protein n=1 Tax=Gemmatimonas sp. TaxID=1962908 RepID=UPI0037BEDA23
MKGGKGGMGRSGGKPNRGGKPAGKPGAAGSKSGPAAKSKFAGKPKRGEAKAGYGGRSSADDETRQDRPARTTSRPPVAAARPPRGADTTSTLPSASASASAPTRSAVSVQRTLNVPASAVIRAINDTERRGWSPEPLYRVMSVLAPRFIRVAFPDGSLAAFSVNRQGNARCTVTVELSKLPEGADEKQLRDRWSYALAALQEQVDHSWD